MGWNSRSVVAAEKKKKKNWTLSKKQKQKHRTLSKHLEKLVGKLGFSLGTFPKATEV